MPIDFENAVDDKINKINVLKYKDIQYTIKYSNWNDIVSTEDYPNLINILCLTNNIRTDGVIMGNNGYSAWFTRFVDNLDNKLSSGTVTLRIWYM